MPLIESEQIELIDLTDSRPAFLSLSTSLPKMQTEERNVFSPDYTNEKTPQIITPTLFLGQEKIDIKEVLKKDQIKYSINSKQVINNPDSPEIYVSDNCLYIEKNLDADSWVITATIESLDYKGSQYQNITAETELFKVSGSTKQFLALLSSSDGRSFFEPTNRDEITLTATLYFGGETYKGGVEYQWYKNGAIITENGSSSEYTVTVKDVDAMSNYHCSITVTDVGDKYLTPSITIMDKTDPYSAQIISSKGLIFSTDNDETELDCRVYQSNKEFTSTSLNYKWYKGAINIGNELKDEDGKIVNTKTINVRPQDENTTEVTYYCVAKINETEIVSQITLMVAPRFNTIITPKQIFVPFTGDKYNGADFYKMQFYLQFLKSGSQNVPINKLEHDIKLGDVEKYFSCSSEGEEIIFTKQKNVDWSTFPDSSICSIYYTYKGIQLQEEFYFIKNIEGATPTINYFYARNNSGTNPPAENDPNWEDSISEANKTSAPYLWTKTVISFNDGRLPLISYSVIQDGFSPARLVLQASRSRAQIQKGQNNFEPNYSADPQVITPYLYIGQKLINLSENSINVEYSIDGETNFPSGVSKNDENQTLIIETNLSGNTTWVITATINEFEYNNAMYTNITDQTDLTCLTSSSEISLQLEADREFFSPKEQTNITLTATFHEGKGTVGGQVFEWRKNGVVIKNETGAKLTVQKGDVQSVAIYSCSTQYLGNTYKDEITINDFSDPYTAMITSSTGTIFNSKSVLPSLTCKVFRGTEFISDVASYQWYIIKGAVSTSLAGATLSTYQITKEDFSNASNKSVTFLCHVTIDTDSVDAIITLFITDFTIKIFPEIITLPFYSNDTYAGDIANDEYIIKCSIIDSLGNILPQSKIKNASLSLPGDNSGSYFKVTPQNNDENNAEYNYKIELNERESYPNLKDSNIGTFSFSYDVSGNNDIEEEEPEIAKEFYLIKNIKSSEFTGAEVKYLYSSNASTNPDDAAADNNKPKPTWYDSKVKAAEKNSNNDPYLWTKTIYNMDNGGSKVSYSVSDRNKIIKSAEELYAIGLRGTGQVYIQEAGKSQEIDLAILYNYTKDSIWKKEVPSYGADSAGKEENLNERLIYVFDREHENKTVTNIKASAGEILWVKYIFTYDDGSTDTSAPVISSAIDGLRASVYDVQTNYTKSSIENIVKEMRWDKSGGKTLTSYIEQLSSDINTTINYNNELETWLRFNINGLTLGKSNSNYNTFIDDKGFYIKHLSGNAETIVGKFDSEGLVISQIALSSGKIIMKKTINGGWSWVKS